MSVVRTGDGWKTKTGKELSEDRDEDELAERLRACADSIRERALSAHVDAGKRRRCARVCFTPEHSRSAPMPSLLAFLASVDGGTLTE